MRGPRRRGERTKAAEKETATGPQHEPAANPQPSEQVPGGNAPANDPNSGDSATAHGTPSIISAIVTGIAVVAAIAAIPSWGALLAFPLGAAAVAGAVFAWRLAGSKRILCLGYAAGERLVRLFRA